MSNNIKNLLTRNEFTCSIPVFNNLRNRGVDVSINGKTMLVLPGEKEYSYEVSSYSDYYTVHYCECEMELFDILRALGK